MAFSGKSASPAGAFPVDTFAVDPFLVDAFAVDPFLVDAFAVDPFPVDPDTSSMPAIVFEHIFEYKALRDIAQPLIAAATTCTVRNSKV